MDEATSVQQAGEDLAAIRHLMESAQETVAINGWKLVLWGGLISAAEAVSYWTPSGGPPVPLWQVWGVAVGLGWAISISVRRRRLKRAAVNSLANRILAAIWVGCGLGLTLLGFCGRWSGTLTGPATPGVMSVVIGTAFFASSSFCNRALFRGLAIVWWALGGTMLVWSRHINDLLMCAGLLLFMVLPGLLLSRGVRPSSRLYLV